jgi:BNR-Asp box repeat
MSLGTTGGLWRSSNYGKSFTQIQAVQRALLFTFGLAVPASDVPAHYVLGTSGNETSVFTSSDFGSTWDGI